MSPRKYRLIDATTKLGYTSVSTFRKKYLETDAQKRELGHHLGARGEVLLMADAVDDLAVREEAARQARGNWRSANLGVFLGNPRLAKRRKKPTT